MDNSVEDLGGCLVGKGKLARDQLPHEDAEGVDITGGGQPAGSQHLRRHVSALTAGKTETG